MEKLPHPPHPESLVILDLWPQLPLTPPWPLQPVWRLDSLFRQTGERRKAVYQAANLLDKLH